jgi:O-antigen ligase
MQGKLENLIYNNTFFCALLFIPFVEPLYFTQFVLIDTIFLYWKLASIAIIIFVWGLCGKIDKVLGSLAAFLLLDCIVTTINEGNTSQMYINAVTLFAMAIMFMTVAKKGSYKFVKVVSTVFEILIIANFLTIVIYPDGLYNFSSVNHHYLLGSRNVMMRTIFPGICFSIIRSKIETNKLSIRTIIVMIVAGVSLVLVWSATALVAYFLFCFFIVLFQKKGTPKWFTVKTCYLLVIVIFIAIVVLQLQNLFSFIIVDILHKDTTFTGRTILWVAGMYNIARSPFVGYGLESLETIAAKLYKYTQYDSCHNFILDILYQNGIIGFALLLVLFISTEKKVDQCLSEKYKTIFTLFIFAYAIMINFEPFINGDMRLLISMLVYINYFNEGAMEGKTSDLRRIKVRLGSIRLN